MIKRIIKTCSHCGSKDILIDAWVKWNEDMQKYEITDTFLQAYCNKCNGKTIVDTEETE